MPLFNPSTELTTALSEDVTPETAPGNDDAEISEISIGARADFASTIENLPDDYLVFPQNIDTGDAQKRIKSIAPATLINMFNDLTRNPLFSNLPRSVMYFLVMFLFIAQPPKNCGVAKGNPTNCLYVKTPEGVRKISASQEICDVYLRGHGTFSIFPNGEILVANKVEPDGQQSYIVNVNAGGIIQIAERDCRSNTGLGENANVNPRGVVQYRLIGEKYIEVLQRQEEGSTVNSRDSQGKMQSSPLSLSERVFVERKTGKIVYREISGGTFVKVLKDEVLFRSHRVDPALLRALQNYPQLLQREPTPRPVSFGCGPSQ